MAEPTSPSSPKRAARPSTLSEQPSSPSSPKRAARPSTQSEQPSSPKSPKKAVGQQQIRASIARQITSSKTLGRDSHHKRPGILSEEDLEDDEEPAAQNLDANKGAEIQAGVDEAVSSGHHLLNQQPILQERVLQAINLLEASLEMATEHLRLRKALRSEEKGGFDANEREINIDQLLQMLTLCYLRIEKWDKVRGLANATIEDASDFPYKVVSEEVRLDIRMRRGVAISHCAGPTEDNPYRAPLADELDLAEKDFLELQKARPKDNAVKRGLQQVSFLKKQAAVAQAKEDSEELYGLARLRAMDP